MILIKMQNLKFIKLLNTAYKQLHSEDQNASRENNSKNKEKNNNLKVVNKLILNKMQTVCIVCGMIVN